MTDITAKLLTTDLGDAMDHYREQRGQARNAIINLRAETEGLRRAILENHTAYQETIDLIQRRNEVLTKALESMIDLAKGGDFSTGVCCCGNSLDDGRTGCDGHMSVDAGDYHASCVISAAVAVLMKEDDGDGG